MNNKKLGSKFEKDFAEYLSKKGYWVHYVEGSAHTGSQPCDLIAIKNDIPYCIDCKTLENKSGTFNLNRIEENQRLAFGKYIKSKNTNFYLAILWNNNVYRVWLKEVDFYFKKSINVKDYNIIVEDFYNENNS